MTHRTFAVIMTALLTLACAAILAIGESAAHAATPTLEAAPYAPTRTDYVRPHHSRYVGNDQCEPDAESYFTDVQPYVWRADAWRSVGSQRWDSHRTRWVWRAPSGRSVTFDGVEWRNHLRVAVVVAGWCDPTHS